MKKIYVGNLARETTDEGLATAFTPFGEIRSASVIKDRITGESRGFGFVEMERDDEAAAAIAALDQKPIDGRVVNVSEARPRAEGSRPSSRGGGGGRRGFGGGRDRGGDRDRGGRY